MNTHQSVALLGIALLGVVTTVGIADERRANTADVPASIPADGSRDVTKELNEFLAGVKEDTRVVFPEGARYRIDGTVVLTGKRRITIEGNGVVLRAVDRGEDHAKKENYAGWKATRNRAHVRLTECSDVIVRNVEVHGAHPNPGREGEYDANREAQHGFDVVGVERCTLDGVTVHDVYGDCVYVAKSRGVMIRGATLTRCGRQGVAVVSGRDVVIEGNTIDDSRRGIIDIEPYGKDWATTNISIINNRLGGSRLLLLPMGGSGVIGAVFLADNINTEPNGTPAVYNVAKANTTRGPFVAVNNRFAIGGSSAPGLRVTGNDGVLLAGNVFTYPANRKMTGMDLTGSTGVVIANALPGAAELVREGATVAALSNTLDADATTAPAQTQWRRIDGGYAVRTTLDDGTIVIALLRGGLTPAGPGEPITGYGLTTDGDFAWAHVKDGKINNGAVRGGEYYRLE